jgi:hypothetical protein
MGTKECLPITPEVSPLVWCPFERWRSVEKIEEANKQLEVLNEKRTESVQMLKLADPLHVLPVCRCHPTLVPVTPPTSPNRLLL